MSWDLTGFGHEETWQRFLLATISNHLNRIHWPAARIHLERERGLRRLLATAKQHSAWHAHRLAEICADTVSETDLSRIPPMTKDDLMDHFDDILTDKRLSRNVVESHLSTPSSDNYLFRRYRVFVSGGTSGRRGIFVYDRRAFLLFGVTVLRYGLQEEARHSELLQWPRAIIASEHAGHVSRVLATAFRAPGVALHVLPVTQPLDQLVEGLNKIQPTILVGHASVLHSLAAEQQAGRLSIAPRRLISGAEPLYPEMRIAIEGTWGLPVANVYATSEGGSAASCVHGVGLHLNEDVCIFEFVDAQGHPVEPGERAAKVYITNLYNPIQPLIRYEITDEAMLLSAACPCGSAMRRIEDVSGRSEEQFTYPDGLVVRPKTFRRVLEYERHIAEYQVRQTEHGASISVRIDGEVDLVALQAKIADQLCRVGLRTPEIHIEVVRAFVRPEVGKHKRFVPLVSPI